MILLDTDILSLFTRGDPRVRQRVQTAADTVGTTIVTGIEILQARNEPARYRRAIRGKTCR